MQIEPAGRHYIYIITDFDKDKFPINYDKKRFPKGFDTINIDCYGDRRLRHMFLSGPDDWMTVENKSDIEKIVMFIEGSIGLKKN